MRGLLILKKIAMVLTLGLSCYTHCSFASTVTAVALFNDRAMLSVDGSKAKIVRSGASFKGIKLISSNTSEAIVEVAGVRKTLRLNGTTNLSSSIGNSSDSIPSSVTIYVDESGFFRSRGKVNGRATNFLIDTGANLVVFSSRQAKNLNIDYLNGRKGYASTASGRASMYGITLDEISLGGISLKNVDAGVIEGGFPEVPLLGMTFLQRLEMNRSGVTMVLRKP
jgi:aspartyl protease family protein